MTTCSLVHDYQCFGSIYRLHHHRRTINRASGSGLLQELRLTSQWVLPGVEPSWSSWLDHLHFFLQLGSLQFLSSRSILLDERADLSLINVLILVKCSDTYTDCNWKARKNFGHQFHVPKQERSPYQYVPGNICNLWVISERSKHWCHSSSRTATGTLHLSPWSERCFGVHAPSAVYERLNLHCIIFHKTGVSQSLPW
jgi:hypothetical protein